MNHVNVNWDQQAAEAAKGYMQEGGFSYSGMVQQLESPDGNDFTDSQAGYGAEAVGLDSRLLNPASRAWGAQPRHARSALAGPPPGHSAMPDRLGILRGQGRRPRRQRPVEPGQRHERRSPGHLDGRLVPLPRALSPRSALSPGRAGG